VVGVGGVGSWAAEALARSGVAALTLIDLDQVSESNVNRQVQALGATLGMAKVEALRARIADIHPGCAVAAVEEFVDEANWPGLLARRADVVVDACDDVRAKACSPPGRAPADAARQRRRRGRQARGRAGRGRRPGRRHARPDARRAAPAPAQAPRRAALGRARRVLRVLARAGRDAGGEACDVDGSLNCHGYGSSVAVTATFGMVAAARALESRRPSGRPGRRTRQLIIMGSEGC
jgi:hypothetical protein